MSWGLITEDWRLKLLGLALAVLMLGAVAFSQNPPTSKTLDLPLSYAVRSNIVLINPPTDVPVTVSGLADAIAQVKSNNVTASVDATQVLPGSAVHLNITARPLIGGVSVTQPGPFAVKIDSLASASIPLNVVAPAAPGWAITKSEALCPSGACTSVNFTGPVSWETNLIATVTAPSPIGPDVGCTGLACVKEWLNQPVQLRNYSGPLDLASARSQTIPTSSLDIAAVTIHVEAAAGVTSSTVPLVIAPPQPPPAGYQITGVSISPVTVVVSGDPGVLGRVQRITLPAVDLSNSTSDATFDLPIPYPRGVTGSAALAKVVYSISRNPQVSPSPSP